MALTRPYFPVERQPLRMLPRLAPFGKSFGNPFQDRLFFQIDDARSAYRQAKLSPSESGGAPPCQRLRINESSETERDAHHAILSWMDQTLRREHPGIFPQPPERPKAIASHWHSVGLDVQEDLVAIQQTGDGGDQVIGVNVCFPSGWRPETILGHTFHQIHDPVPGFATRPEAAQSLARAMFERGPYVRFVWTLCADDRLDHHPEQGRPTPWTPNADRGWLRVERQVTVPFPSVDAALFLIRTYVTPFDALGADQADILMDAIDGMPADVLRYKNLNRAGVRRALRRSREPCSES